MGWDEDIRVGTADRERAIEALSEHLSAGRVEVSEYDIRCAAAAGARTRADVLALFADLPQPHPVFDEPDPAPPAPAADRSLVRAEPKRANGALIGFIAFALAGVVVVTVMTGFWWAMVPILVIGLLLLLMS